MQTNVSFKRTRTRTESPEVKKKLQVDPNARLVATPALVPISVILKKPAVNIE